ncbi:nucleotidyltransferase family protein [Synechococcus sp.]
MNTHAQSYWQRERWPLIKSIWVFGSVLGEGFHEESDIDLMVEGLPPQDLLRFCLLSISEALVAAALRLHSFYTAVAALMASNCAARLVPTTCEVPRRF